MLVVWNGTTKRQKNLLAFTLTIRYVRPYTWAIAEKERRRAVDVFVRLGSTLVTKVSARVSTALVRKDVDKSDLNDVDTVVVTEELKWFLTRALTPVDCHIRIGSSVEGGQRIWKRSNCNGHDGQGREVQHFVQD